MRNLLISLVFLASLAPVGALAQSAPDYSNVVASCGTVNGAAYVAGTNRPQTIDTSGRPCPAGATPTGTQDVNIIQTGGVTQLRGAGGVGTGSERIAVGQDTTTIAGSAPGTAASPSANVLSHVNVASAASVAGVAPVFSASVETGHVIKASAGNLYSISATADATLSAAAWTLMVFNSTTVPAAGAVTPAWCLNFPAGTTGYAGAFPVPMYLGTGVSAAVSVGATCFTKTDSAHAFISGNAQ